jgi:hypothetical protein
VGAAPRGGFLCGGASDIDWANIDARGLYMPARWRFRIRLCLGLFIASARAESERDAAASARWDCFHCAINRADGGEDDPLFCCGFWHALLLCYLG